MTTIGGSATRAVWAGDSMVLGAMVVALMARFGARAGHWSAAVGGLRRWALVSGVFTLFFLAGQVPVGLGPALPGIGLVQPLMFAMVMTLLVVLARSAAAASVATASGAAASDAHAPLQLGARSECGESA